MKKDWMVKQSELDQDQMKLIMGGLDKSCIVAGCAGSGKSILALIKAQRVQREYGNNYKIIVFTKALCHYMNSGKEELGLNNDIYYHWDWKVKKNKPSADYIIVDEIQDYTDAEIKEFVQAARKQFFFFGDTAQSIYDGMKKKDGDGRTVPVEDIRDVLPPRTKSAKYHLLYRNYRLPIPVAKVACGISLDTDFEDETYMSPETSKPRIIRYVNQQNQLEAIHRIIKDRNLTDVAILLPHNTSGNSSVKSVYEKLKALGGNYEMKCGYGDGNQDTLDFNSTNPKIMTYHSAKGLQFETVFLPMLEDFDEDMENMNEGSETLEKLEKSKRKALYVAMTRTYRDLYIMYSGQLPDVISDNVEENLYKKTETDEIEDF